MLHALNNKTVEGDGFRVFVPDVHSVIYTENERTAHVEIEGGMSSGVVDWLGYSETLSGWNTNNDVEPMTEMEKEIALRRISECLSLLKMPHKLA